MNTNRLTITIAGSEADLLAELAKETGRSYDDLVAEAIHRAYSGRWQTESPQRERTPEEQKANRQRLMEELDKLPVMNPDDGFSSEHHDEILYGGDW